MEPITDEALAAIEALAEKENCDWPEGKGFTFLDSPGEHDPCYAVMPDGALLVFNHHAGKGVDIARCQFVVSACDALPSLLSRLRAAEKERERMARFIVSRERAGSLCAIYRQWR